MPTHDSYTKPLPSLMYIYTSSYTTSYYHYPGPSQDRPAVYVAAVLRDISEGTSYQAVRLVFRHYAHLTTSSCTSERLRTSSGLSSTFIPNTHSSLPFGSHNRVSSFSTPNTLMISLVRVPRRVKLLRSTLTFSFLILPFFTFQSLYLFTIGHQPVFSLR